MFKYPIFFKEKPKYGFGIKLCFNLIYILKTYFHGSFPIEITTNNRIL